MSSHMSSRSASESHVGGIAAHAQSISGNLQSMPGDGPHTLRAIPIAINDIPANSPHAFAQNVTGQAMSTDNRSSNDDMLSGEAPAKKPVCTGLAAAMMRAPSLDTTDVTCDDMRTHLQKVSKYCLSRPPRRWVVVLAGGTRGAIPEWGTAEEVSEQLFNVLARGAASTSWLIALKCITTMHCLVRGGGAAALAMAQVLDPRPGECMLGAYDSSYCGNGIKQRPVVAFAAGALRFVLDMSAIVNPADMDIIAKSGIPIRRHGIASSDGSGNTRDDTPSGLLMRCVSLQGYLNYLLSAVDLPLLAMDNDVSVSVLDRVIEDSRVVYGCIWRHMEAIVDPRYHALHIVTEADAKTWSSLFNAFRNSGARLAGCYARLADLSVGLTETIPSIAAFPPEASDRLLDLTARLAVARKAEADRRLQRVEAGAPSPDDSSADGQSNGRSSDYGGSERSPGTTLGGLVAPFVDRSEDTFRDGALTEADETEDRDTEVQSSVFSENNGSQAGRYILGDVLGRGAFGTVFKAFDSDEGHFVAVKELKADRDSSTTRREIAEMQREFDVVANAHDRNVVSVYSLDASVDSPFPPRIIMEWMPGGSIQSALKLTKRGFKEGVVARYTRQAMQGLAFLHSRGIVHRDIKPANMLLSATGDVKLSDFGTSRINCSGGDNNKSMQTGTVVGTVPYLAPECFRGSYSNASDVWAMGCSTLEMLTGEMPWHERGTRDVLSLVFIIGNAQPPDHHPALPDVNNTSGESPLLPGGLDEGLMCGASTISDIAASFLVACFTYDPKTRPDAKALLQHPFLRDYN